MTFKGDTRQSFLQEFQVRCDSLNQGNSALGLLVFDILSFHRVNAVYGFRIGDCLLEKVRERVIATGFKNSTVARIGNDEFALILTHVKDPKLLTLAANKLVRVLSEPFDIEDRIVRVEPVVGIAADKGEGLNAERLLVAAEKNLSDARKQNKHFLTFKPEKAMSAHNWQFESQLHQAVAENMLSLYYQPKIHLPSGFPSHSEALARWQHPDLGMVAPIEFIPILESSGAIEDMTKWAIHTALREIVEWPQPSAIQQSFDYSVAVNVSSRVLENPEFIDVVRSAINIWGVSASCLTLEVTEGALIQEEASSYQSLNQLKELGLKISIDDFGTGYSCLSYFKQLPADELKIDQSFIKNMQSDKDDEHLTGVIIDLAHRFNMKVVAEGVEDQDTLNKLKMLGCDYVQGFYFSKALPQEKYKDWLAGYKPEG